METPRALEDAARELLRAADRLRRLAEAEALRLEAAGPAPEIAGAHVRALLAARRLPAERFGAAVDGPALSLLLALYAARLDGARATVSAAAAEAGLAPATAQRRIERLERAGLIRRRPDPDDERRVHLALADETADRLSACLAAALRLSPWLL